MKKQTEILTASFRELGRELGLMVRVIDGRRLMVVAPLWRRALSTESSFCQALVASGLLTEQQMRHAASRYRLGASRQGGVIYWQIDREDDIHDGKVMYYRPDCHRDKQHKPTWVSHLLQRRHRWADKTQATHCFFGLHLVDGSLPVAIVEAEKTAVILSEHYPQHVWLASGGLGEVQADKFRPLRGLPIVMFPDTDPEGLAFQRWYNAARWVEQQAWWADSPPIFVSPLLEQRATCEQKERKIDLADYMYESTV